MTVHVEVFRTNGAFIMPNDSTWHRVIAHADPAVVYVIHGADRADVEQVADLFPAHQVGGTSGALIRVGPARSAVVAEPSDG